MARSYESQVYALAEKYRLHIHKDDSTIEVETSLGYVFGAAKSPVLVLAHNVQEARLTEAQWRAALAELENVVPYGVERSPKRDDRLD